METSSTEESIEGNDDHNSSNTEKSTKHWINVLMDYLNENGHGNLDYIENTELDSILETFYRDVRMNPISTPRKTKSKTKDSLMYSNGSLKVMRAGINRYLKYTRGVDIITDGRFTKSNQTFKSILCQGKSEGRCFVERHGPIPQEDINKMTDFLSDPDNESPKILQMKVLFDVLYYLCRRGRDYLREMTRDTFQISVSENGLRYVHGAVGQAGSGHSGTNAEETSDCVMYEIPDSPACPVMSFEKYLSHLNPYRHDLWQQPRRIVIGRVWYDDWALGKNTLGNFVKELSRLAGCSREYTNYDLRATSKEHPNHYLRNIDISKSNGSEIGSTCMKIEGVHTQFKSASIHRENISVRAESVRTPQERAALQPKSTSVQPESALILERSAESVPMHPGSASIHSESAPIPQKSAPLQLESVHMQPDSVLMKPKSVPIQLESAPIQPKSVLMQTESAPLSQKSAPLKPKSAHMPQKSAPVQPKIAHMQPKSGPVHPERVRMQLKTGPMDFKSAPIRQKSAPIQQNTPEQVPRVDPEYTSFNLSEVNLLALSEPQEKILWNLLFDTTVQELRKPEQMNHNLSLNIRLKSYKG